MALAATGAARADTSQVWPELDLWSPTFDSTRVILRAATVRDSDSGERVNAAAKLLVDYQLSSSISLRAGYSYASTPPASAGEHHSIDRYAILQMTYLWVLDSGVHLSNRIRTDLGNDNGVDYQRYRDRVQAEYKTHIDSQEVTPYGNLEAYYDSRYQGVSRYRLEIGATTPLAKAGELDLYIARQRDVRPSLKVTDAIGVTLNIWL
jgi:hypothetical protein